MYKTQRSNSAEKGHTKVLEIHASDQALFLCDLHEILKGFAFAMGHMTLFILVFFKDAYFEWVIR